MHTAQTRSLSRELHNSRALGVESPGHRSHAETAARVTADRATVGNVTAGGAALDTGSSPGWMLGGGEGGDGVGGVLSRGGARSHMAVVAESAGNTLLLLLLLLFPSSL